MELGWYDFTGRFYMSDIVRTPTLDPHAENFYSESPYSFLGNNPINNVDPTGMDWFVNNDDGSLYYYKDVTEVTDDMKEITNNWENFGADDMFDTDDIKYSEIEHIFQPSESAEAFMNDYGYEMADRTIYEKTTAEDSFSEEPGHTITTTISKEYAYEEDITYVTPEKLNTTTPLSSPVIDENYTLKYTSQIFKDITPHNDTKGGNNTTARSSAGKSLILTAVNKTIDYFTTKKK